MKISKRGEYALRALIDLGIASELGWPMLQISELASKEKLPIKFLEQIFTQLKAGGYVSSRRGKFGGYSLARPMSQIKFGAVIRLIDGPLAPIRCVSQTSSVLSWIAILSQTSSRSRFANIGATKLPRLFCTARFRLHRCCPNTRRHFAASEEPRHAIAFQGRQGAEPTIIRQRGGEGGANHVSH